MSDTLPTPNVAGGDVSIPVYSDIAGAVNEWTDGDMSIGDVTTAVTSGLGVLGAALDPIGAITGAIAGWLMDVLVNNIPPLKTTVDSLLGAPDQINTTAQAWYRAGYQLQGLGQVHADSVGDCPTWTGPSAEAYHTVLKGTTGLYAAGQQAAESVAGWITLAGAIVGLFRSMVWDAIKKFLAQVIEAAVAAIASSWFTLGGSVGVFAAWVSGKVAAIAAKFSSWIAKLLRKCAKLAQKLGRSGESFLRAADKMGALATRLSRYARNQFRFGVNATPNMPFDRASDFWDNHSDLKNFKDYWDNADRYGFSPADQAQQNEAAADDEPS